LSSGFFVFIGISIPLHALLVTMLTAAAQAPYGIGSAPSAKYAP
jgi:hypothetical protein